MKRLIDELKNLKMRAEELLDEAKNRQEMTPIDFYRGEIQGLGIAIAYAECRMKKQEEKPKMKFKELRHKIDDRYIILSTEQGRIPDFNCDSEKFDDCEVSTIQCSGKRIFVAVK